MDVDATYIGGTEEVNTFSTKKESNQKLKGSLTEEQKQALQTLNMCFYCRQEGHISTDCEKKKKKFGQNRRVLLGQPVRPLPQNFQKPITSKIRSTEVKGE
jgi:hypothetical protein